MRSLLWITFFFFKMNVDITLYQKTQELKETNERQLILPSVT